MTGFSASIRSREREMMDDDAIDADTFRDYLVDLARVNRLSLGYRPTLRFLSRLRAEGRWPADRPLAILDAGAGYGDMAREIALWARRAGLAVTIACVDRNPWAEKAARAATPADAPIVFRTADVFDLEAEAAPDVVVCSLFTHHLDEATLVRFLAFMERTARLGWFVNDLRRSRLGFLGFAAAARVLGLHPFVRHDGPVSFARSFRERDWREAVAAAGLEPGEVDIRRWAPFRLCVSRIR